MSESKAKKQKEPLVNGATVGGDPAGARVSSNRQFRVAILVFVLLLVITAVFAALNHKVSLGKHPTSKTLAFTIEGKDYTKADISKLLMDAPAYTGKTSDEATKNAFNYYEEKQATQDIGLTVPDNLINQEAAVLANGNDSYQSNAWIRLIAFHNALNDYYDALQQGVYRGYSFAFDFSAKELPQDTQATTPGQGDKQLIANDQAYAKAKAEYYHDQIATGKMTPDQLIAQIKSDPLLGLTDNNVSFSALNSTRFDNANDYISGQVFYTSIVDYLNAQTKTGLGAVQLGQINIASSSAKASKYAPGVYYFVQLDSLQKAMPNARQDVQTKIKNMKATYYGL